MVAPPVTMSETPGAVRRAAPLVGEHTAAVLRERLNMSDEEIERLRQSSVIGRQSASQLTGDRD